MSRERKGRAVLCSEQTVNGAQVSTQHGRIGDHIGEVRREKIGPVITHRRVGFHFIDGKRLEDIDAKCRKIGNLANDIEEI